jgi:hypothetical protein
MSEYTGPFPRGRHSHKCCRACGLRGFRSVACYKARCTKGQAPDICGVCRSPLDARTLPTLEYVPAARAEVACEAAGAELTAQLLAPLESISAKTGRMESQSPLFRESDANPQGSLF